MRPKVAWIAPLVLLAWVAAGPSPSTATPSVPGACGSWELVSSPNVGSAANQLSGVAAASSSDVWAVGTWYSGSVFRTLAEHWDGSAWTIAPTPNVGTHTNELRSVAAVSATDVWAVGHYDDGTTFRTLAERWDGTSWKVVTTPNAGSGENVLLGVAAVGPNDVWAVGYQEPSPGSHRQTLAEHWNGTSWTVVPTPSAGTDDNYLWSVAPRSSSDVWATGSYSVPWSQTLAEHWDGTSWTVVPTPNYGNGDNALYAAAALRHGAVVAAGTWLGGFGTKTLVERWDRANWSGVRTPSPGGYLNELSGLAAVNAVNIRAVGYTQDQIGDLIETLVLHWDGAAWTREPAVDPGSTGSIFAAIARVPGTHEFWAVGHYADVGDRTLIEHRC